ncbi:Cytochrome 71D6 [Capsicum chinense]|nr:Cytochrome 71D6 [Capsicum chinense]
MVVVSSVNMAREVLKTHDLAFASRPKLLSLDIICYKCTNIAFSPYGEYWRQMRKVLFSAETETSGTTVIWAMTEMMRNPSVLAKAQAEVRDTFKGKETFDEDVIEELKYLKQVVKETLRLHPPLALLVPRECREETNINGYTIPLKTRVMVNV